MSNWTFEEQYWRNKVELPFDVNHICRRGVGPTTASQNPEMGRREQDCPGCTYVRGFKDGQAHE